MHFARYASSRRRYPETLMVKNDPHGPADATAIAHYHAHIYYDPAASRDRAARLRDRMAAGFPDAQLGRWHDVPVGPHPQAMYQVAFPAALLADLVPFLMLNRDGLTVLLHPETGDDYADHARHAVWFGEVLPLRLEMFATRGA
jgi:DOPA 4,5-dioxygenase